MIVADVTVTVLVDENLLKEALARNIDIRGAIEAQLRLELKVRDLSPQDGPPQHE